MKKFVIHIVLFLLPLFLGMICCIPFYEVALQSGEFSDWQANIVRQRENHNVLIGMGYNEQTSYYKLVNADYYEAEVLALGTSRVMQFKNDFFSGTFYNCGGAVGGNYNEYRNFLQNLSYKPKCIILGLDSWVFNDTWNQYMGDYSDFVEIKYMQRNRSVMLKSMITSWMQGNWTFKSIKTYPDNIGFNGRIKDAGFMYDGSYYYGDVYRHPEEQEGYLFENTMDRIANGNRRFEWADHIDQDTLIQLDNLLSYCKTNNIEVIGFLPPFAPAVYKTMEETGNYGYLTEIEPACIDLFDEYGYEFYNYVDGACFNVTDDYFVDGFHGSEVVYGYIVEDMAAHGSVINKYADLDNLNNLLQNAYDGLTFYKPDERPVE